MSTTPQPCLPELFGPRVPRAHKAQRTTAREVYRRQRAIDQARAVMGGETREGQVLRCLAAYWNRHQASPTARELLAWMHDQGEPVDDVNSVRPRINALVAHGLVEPRAKRPCRITKKTVWTWAVREIGSAEPR